MGQKINPRLFQLSKTNKWQSKYSEKVPVEFSVYSKKDQEIRTFIRRFFKMHQKILHNCQIYYFNKSFHIFISYYAKIKKTKFNQFFNRTKEIKKLKARNLLDYSRLEWIFEENYEVFEAIKTKFFLKNLFKSLTSFTNQKIKFFLVLKELKSYTKQIIVRKKTRNQIKKSLTSLRRYEENTFFKEGITILFNCATNKNSSSLLAQFIATQLKNLKRHNFFIKFIRNVLKLFKNNQFSKFKGIKIEIKGRINRRPRARSKIVKISNTVSVLTIDSIISYSEKISFTPNGTLGVKVWVHEL